MAAKRAPKRAQVDPPANETCGSAEPATDGEATKTLAPPPQPTTAEQQVAHITSDELQQRATLLADIAARIFRQLAKCVTDEQKNLRVLGVITWVFLLALPASFAVVLIILVFRWDPVHTIWLLTSSTGLVAGTNVINRVLRRRK